MDQQSLASNGADPLPVLDPQPAVPAAALGHDLLGQADADAMASVMAGQPFLQDPSMAAMPLADSSLMLPMVMANGGTPVRQNNSISKDDIALYDRQIRLWGMAAQAKIQNASILLITIKALASEIAKNLVLAGVGSLTLLDGSPVTEADLGAQFFLSEPDGVVGQNRAQAASAAIRKLNPRVHIHVDPESVTAKGPSYFAGYDVVIATDLDPDTFNIINTATRINGKAFYAAGTHGMYGFIFSDLIEHDYVIERDAGNVTTEPKQETRTRSIVSVKTRRDGPKTVESVTKRELYSTWFLASDLAVLPDDYTKSKRRLKSVSPTLSCLRALWEFKQLKGGAALPSTRDDLKVFTQIATQKHKALSLPSETLRPEFLRSFLQNLGSEMAPVAAVLGGQLAQDVINVLGHTQQPIQNMVVFDGDRMEATMYPLHPEGALGANLLSLGGAAGAPNVPNGGDPLMTSAVAAAPGLGGLPMDAAPAPLGPAMPPPEGLPTGDGSVGASAPDMSAPEAASTQPQSSLDKGDAPTA